MSHEESENDVSRVRHARMYFLFDKFQINRQKEQEIIPSMIKSARKYTGRMIKKKEKFLISVDCWWVSYPFFPFFLPLTHPYQTNYFPSSILISTSFYLWASERATSTCWEKWESQNFFFSLSTFHSLSRSNSNSIKAYKFKRKKN